MFYFGLQECTTDTKKKRNKELFSFLGVSALNSLLMLKTNRETFCTQQKKRDGKKSISMLPRVSAQPKAKRNEMIPNKYLISCTNQSEFQMNVSK